MKKNVFSLMALMISLLAFTACSSSDDDNDSRDNNSTEDNGVRADSTGRTLVVYYSQKLPDGVDGTTGATDIIRDGDTQYGSNQYLALMIARKVNADTLRLTVRSGYYPRTYNELASFARDERDNNTHPVLTSRRVDMSDYNNIFISAPVWWGTIPMPVASFLDAYDLSGKHVFVVTTHAGSGAGSNRSTIQQLEPNAIVSSNVLAVRARSVGASTSSTVDDWLSEIGF